MNTLIGTCHSCKRDPCVKPKRKQQHPEEGCTQWTDGKPRIAGRVVGNEDTEWIQYLKESGHYDSYDGMCDCYSCRRIIAGFASWKHKNCHSPTNSK